MSDALETPVALLNDADAAGLAEMGQSRSRSARPCHDADLRYGIARRFSSMELWYPTPSWGISRSMGPAENRRPHPFVKEGLSWDVRARVDTVLRTYECSFGRKSLLSVEASREAREVLPYLR